MSSCGGRELFMLSFMSFVWLVISIAGTCAL
jgi:hypothetical protein